MIFLRDIPHKFDFLEAEQGVMNQYRDITNFIIDGYEKKVIFLHDMRKNLLASRNYCAWYTESVQQEKRVKQYNGSS